MQSTVKTGLALAAAAAALFATALPTAAVAADMRVVAPVSHYTADEDLTAADIVVDGLGEPDGAAIAVYKNDTKTEIKTHVALEHVAWLLGQSGAMRGAALPKVDSWK